MLATDQESHLKGTLPKGCESMAGVVGWFIDSQPIRDLIAEGVKVRVKTGHYEDTGSVLGRHACETTDMTRVILSMPGYARLPGRRIAEMRSRVIDAPSLESPMEVLELTIYGPHRSLFHRERLFDGAVSTREEVIELMGKTCRTNG